MTTWTSADLDLISRTADLYVSPLRDDGITFTKAPAETADAIDAAYEDKYPGSSAVLVMHADGPKSATVVMEPR